MTDDPTTSAPAPVAAPYPRRVHLVGIGGMHMSAIAQILMADGVQVSGSDLQQTDLTRRLAALGARVQQGHAAANIGDAELVVVTAAAKADNPEVAEARRRALPVIARAEMVARLMEGRYGIAVAGTHGKTTTSSLIAFMLMRAGLAPTYLLGGDAVDLGGNAAPGTGPYVVVEADEYARAFLQYRPRLAVVTNVEPDHLDYYGSAEALFDAFRQFLHRVTPDGRIIACADSPTLLELVREGVEATVETYQVVDRDPRHIGAMVADWVAEDEGVNDIGGHTFRLRRHDRPFGRFSTARPGLHNVANATAALAVGATLGVDQDVMAQALRAFRGARRRFELVGEAGGVTVMDDYAHHPTEVRATLAAARERFPGRRLVALFQPHTFSRSAYLLDAFRTCFGEADQLYVLETYAARETPDAGMSAAEFAGEIRGLPVRYVASIPDAAAALISDLTSGDVLFTIGAGDVNTTGPAVLERLRARQPAAGM